MYVVCSNPFTDLACNDRLMGNAMYGFHVLGRGFGFRYPTSCCSARNMKQPPQLWSSHFPAKLFTGNGRGKYSCLGQSRFPHLLPECTHARGTDRRCMINLCTSLPRCPISLCEDSFLLFDDWELLQDSLNVHPK